MGTMSEIKKGVVKVRLNILNVLLTYIYRLFLKLRNLSNLTLAEEFIIINVSYHLLA